MSESMIKAWLDANPWRAQYGCKHGQTKGNLGSALLFAMCCLSTQGFAIAETVYPSAGARTLIATNQKVKPPAVTQEAALNQALEAYSLDDYAKAQRGFELLAAQNVGLAQYNLAMMHLRAEVPKPNLAAARRLLLLAVQGRVVLAHFALSQIYELGAGVPVDLGRTNRWLESGAELGHTDSQTSLATNYFLGRGIAKNPERAAHWFRMAATGGDVGAQYLLASLYEKGDGVVRDLRLAAYWYDAAAKNGDVAAPAKLKEVQMLLETAL